MTNPDKAPPREPTEAMQEAAYDLIPVAPGTETWAIGRWPHPDKLWRAMYDAYVPPLAPATRYRCDKCGFEREGGPWACTKGGICTSEPPAPAELTADDKAAISKRQPDGGYGWTKEDAALYLAGKRSTPAPAEAGGDDALIAELSMRAGWMPNQERDWKAAAALAAAHRRIGELKFEHEAVLLANGLLIERDKTHTLQLAGRQMGDDAYIEGLEASATAAQVESAALRERVAALTADSERYRHWRTMEVTLGVGDKDVPKPLQTVGGYAHGSNYYYSISSPREREEMLDAALDAARQPRDEPNQKEP